jgi:hypothetical protein
VSPRLKRYILGDTDSEVFFFIFLSQLSVEGPLNRRFAVEDAAKALRSTLGIVKKVCDGAGSESRALLTCIVTDGDTMVAAHGGKELFVSTYKTRCGDRGACPSLSAECEAPTRTGFVNHLIFSSQPLLGENVWQELAEGDLMGVDWRMRVHKTRLDRVDLPTVSAESAASR